MTAKPGLTIETLQHEAAAFAVIESQHHESTLYGVTDGKAVGTYLEHKFKAYLHTNYGYHEGNSAKGIDFPDLQVDLKVTSIRQPQSSCPFQSARQKIFGLGYSLLIFVYEKTDDPTSNTGNLNIRYTIFISAERTADHQMTRGLRQLLENDANKEDLIAYMNDRNLPIDDIQANELAEALLQSPPEQGYLTISNALQWRLQYARVIEKAGRVPGIKRLT